MKEKKSIHSTLRYIKKTYQYAKEARKYLVYFLIACILYSVISIVAPLLSAKRIVALTSEV